MGREGMTALTRIGIAAALLGMLLGPAWAGAQEKGEGDYTLHAGDSITVSVNKRHRL